MVARRQQQKCSTVTYQKVIEFLQENPDKAPYLPELEDDVPEVVQNLILAHPA